MTPFAYSRAPDIAAAVARAAAGGEYIAGGTDMVQLLEEGVRAPAELVDIGGLGLARIEMAADSIQVGALAHLSDVARHEEVRRRFPVVSQALDESASPQVRNMATMGGNLLQRTRCLYFRDAAMPCNRRNPGSGCAAREGCNELNAILGGSLHCVAVHPSDLAVALVAVDAELEIAGAERNRRIAVADLHPLPGDTPHVETMLAPGDLIMTVCLPMAMADRASAYVKVRHRASFEWAVVACAVTLALDGEIVADARIVAGGVATKPWRLTGVEQQLVGRRPDLSVIATAAERASDGAAALPGNAYKVPLLVRTMARALAVAAGLP